MKSWGKRRKAKEQALAQAENFANPEPQVQSQSQTQSNPFGKSLRRKKTQVQESKPELDLATVLPDTSDFRTSLMMPTFSARFSMLREVDDPSTKIGKASDDSVLFPKRASRMNLFANNPLTDIAEVDSIRGSTFRPPFADSRTNSFSGDGYASDDGGSIMSRSKPGEGNNLFGGRQKLYRIPAKADGEGFGPTGRHMYENDVSMSMFQQLRLKEKMERAMENRASEDTNERPGSLQQTTDTEDVETMNSPSTGFSKNRGTTSSTTSAPSNRRTSTAATSVASESPALPPNNSSASVNGRISDQGAAVERNSALHKRLYGANLDQVSPNRRNFRDIPEPAATRTRAPSNAKIGPSLSQSRSASNLGEKYSRQNQVFATSAYRGASPPPSAGLPSFTPMDLGVQDGKRSGSPADTRNNMTTPVSEDDDAATYTQNIQPNDRGKATAMGLFNRPQQQYDEQQFTQRQLQMVEGRNSPATSRAGSRASEAQDQRRSSETKKRSSNSRKSPMLKSRTSATTSTGRGSPMADWAPPPTPPLTNRPRTKSSASVAAVANVKARAEELIRRQNAELAALEAQRLERDLPNEQFDKPRSMSNRSATNGTFFDNFDASDEDVEAEPQAHSFRQGSQTKSQEAIHPALRDGSLEFDFGDAVVNNSTSNEATPNESNDSLTALPHEPQRRNEMPTSNSHDLDNAQTSSTLGSGLGLAGMISHMRDNSTGSSIYPPASPAFAPASPQFSGGSQVETPRAASIASTTRTWNPPESIHSDPWDLDKFGGHQMEPQRDSASREPNGQMAKKTQQMLGFATALNQKSKAQQILGEDAPKNDIGIPQQEDNRSTHHRELSSSTQKEREDFDFELAERRRKVNEGLKSAVDTEFYSAGAVSAAQPKRSPSMTSNPFSSSKRTSNNNSPSTKSNEFTNSSKAMKMLGITGPQVANQTSSSRYAQHNAWQEEEERMLQDFGRRPKQRLPEDSYEHPRRSPPRDQSAGRYREQSTNRSGRSTPYEEDRDRARQRSATPNSGRSSRTRSNSATSGRSKSRQGRFRDEPEPAMPGTFPITPMDEMRSPMSNTPRRPSETAMDTRHSGRSGSAMSNRQRTNSRPPTEAREGGGLRRGPSLMTATMPSGQGMRSPRPILSPNESMPSPREMNVDLNRNSPPEVSPLPRPSLSDEMNSPRRAPVPPGASYGRGPSPPQMNDYGSPSSAQPSPRFPENPYPTDRSASGGGGRKKSVTKHMISEPTFLSSTSSVPLVTLPTSPHDAHTFGGVPMLPPQNPRRRGTGNSSGFKTRDISAPVQQTIIPESPDRNAFSYHEAPVTHRPMAADQKKMRNRLRKSSSEGGSMAAKAARQAMQMDHLASPQVPTFPNHSATNLRMEDGGMF